MNHEQIKELLPLYIDHGLTEQEEKLINSHLQNCKDCQEKLKQYQENQELLSAMTPETAPANFIESTLNKINQDTKNRQTGADRNTIIEKIKDFFTLRVRVPAGIIAVAVVVLLFSFTSLPGSLLQYNKSINNSPQVIEEQLDSQYQNFQSATPDVSTNLNTRMKTAESQPAPNNSQLTDSISTEEQKIIKRANIIIELNNIDTIDTRLINLVTEYNGYISNSRNWLNQNKQKFYRFELKIPAANFDNVLTDLISEKYGKVISRSMSSQDVTEEYMDLDIRLNNLLSQEERYRQLLDKASEVEEILKIENELNRTRTDIERLQGRKKYLDNQINYSTITLEIRQPEPISSGTPGITRAIRNAIKKMIDQFYQIIIFTGTIIPYLLLLIIAYLIYKKYKNR